MARANTWDSRESKAEACYVSTFDHVHRDLQRQAAFQSLLVLRIHVLGRGPHGPDDVVQRDLCIGGIAFHGQVRGGDRLHGAHGVPLDDYTILTDNSAGV